MTELEIDKSHLPGVQDVCHVFAVLEDGALAHNLQEQEIEQYYTTNIQKNQLVQNDIRIAKRLQDEEEEQSAQHRAILSQASRRLEEQDSEYARMIQEELQRRADEEARRREREDQEIAKRIQEEEKERVRLRSSVQESISADSASIPSSPTPCPRQPVLSPRLREGLQHLPATSRWQYFTSNTHSQSDSTAEPLSGTHRTAGQNNRSLSSQNRHSAPPRLRNDLLCPPSDALSDEDTDTVFLEHPPLCWPSRPAEGFSMAPSARLSMAPAHQPQGRSYRSLSSHISFREEHHRLGVGIRGEKDERHWSRQDSGRGVQENRNEIWARNARVETEDVRGSDRGLRSEQGRERRYSSGTGDSATGLQERDQVRRSWTYREPSDTKQVRFQDDTGRRCHSYHGDRRQAVNVWQLIARDLKGRGMSVRQIFYGGLLSQGWKGELKDGQPRSPGGDAIDHRDAQHQRAFQRAVSTRRSYHGDVGERRRASLSQAYSGGGYRGEGQQIQENLSIEEAAENGQDVDHRRGRGRGEPGYSLRSVGLREREGSRSDRYHASQSRVTRSASERRRGRKQQQEEQRSSEEEDREGREERSPPPRRVPQRSQSFCSREPSIRARSRHTPRAEAAPQPEEGACLNLGALQQVLLDEELARRLQEEEEDRLLRRGSPACPSPLHDTYTEGDFRVAQVAQDEEIARFMQKQEMKSKRRSCDLDCPGSWRDKDLADPYDRRTARERPVEPSSLRERLDSEGLQSPTEECFPDYQDLSPTSSTPSQQPHRNIAEELDPTFKARRRGKESVGAGPTIPGSLSSSQSHPAPHSGLHESMEEPTFVPPTKRQSEKSGHGKSKEKKENCKHQ
ncbi:uncharacterized protein ccdc187 isoform X1 [Esox lucius]|uniref:uncharacterized protein ccdc187 isoform X1 n=1 Tax=Esox lucius TaxID=8010 RepID=UPI0014776DD8|nr:uncharacterized protein ccdc187 isoform X1 [Esox lucius]XP_019907549.2 uncharacterized protein ccdc187 isoform X1 [Esox lucius]